MRVHIWHPSSLYILHVVLCYLILNVGMNQDKQFLWYSVASSRSRAANDFTFSNQMTTICYLWSCCCRKHKANAQLSVSFNEQCSVLQLFCHRAPGNLGWKFLRHYDEHKQEGSICCIQEECHKTASNNKEKCAFIKVSGCNNLPMISEQLEQITIWPREHLKEMKRKR